MEKIFTIDSTKTNRSAKSQALTEKSNDDLFNNFKEENFDKVIESLDGRLSRLEKLLESLLEQGNSICSRVYQLNRIEEQSRKLDVNFDAMSKELMTRLRLQKNRIDDLTRYSQSIVNVLNKINKKL